MGVSAKAILLGKHNHEEIASVIREVFPSIASDLQFTVLREGEPDVYIRLNEPNPVDATGPKVHQLWVFDGSTSDDRVIYDGERTLLHIGAWGSSTDILMAITSRFGGFFLERDSNNDWVKVPAPRSAYEAATPKDRLKIALAQELPPNLAVELSKIADNERTLDRTISAFHTFQREQDIYDKLELDEVETELEFKGDGAVAKWDFNAGPCVGITVTWTLPSEEMTALVRSAPGPDENYNKLEQAAEWLLTLIKEVLVDKQETIFDDLRAEYEARLSTGPKI